MFTSIQKIKEKKGFTLVELLIVVGILAILSIAVLLVLNPAEILRKGRDTQRISDLAAIKAAIGLYTATASTVDMNGSITTGCMHGTGETTVKEIYISIPSGTSGFPTATTTYSFQSVAAISAGKVNGQGWIPTDITGTTGGASISTWPIDPTNTQSSLNTYAAAQDGSGTPLDLYYQWWCDQSNATFAVVANMESTFYGGLDADIKEKVEEKDGGRCNELYEVGTDLTLGPTGVDDLGVLMQCRI